VPLLIETPSARIDSEIQCSKDTSPNAMQIYMQDKVSTPKTNSYPSLTVRKATVHALALTQNEQGPKGMGTMNSGVCERLGMWWERGLCMSTVELCGGRFQSR
jgi:hypothetical protein